MIFRKKKADYDHIARLERELASMDTLDSEIQAAVDAKLSKRKEFFTPPILKRNSYKQPYWELAHGQTAAYAMSAHPYTVAHGLAKSGLAKQIEIARG